MDSVIAGVVKGLLQKLDVEIQQAPKQLKNDLGTIKSELEAVNRALITPPKANGQREMPELWFREVEELAYDTEDFVDLHTGSGSSLLRWWLRRAKALETGAPFAEEVKRLKKRAQDANRRWKQAAGAPPDHARSRTTCSAAECVPEEGDLVGMDKPVNEVLDLLLLQEASSGGQRQPKRPLKVVAIVGPCGMGKTTLARAVYDRLARDDAFDCRSWVAASVCTRRRDLHAMILEQVNQSAGTSSEETAGGDTKLVTRLQTYLRSKRRYLIVLDGLQLEEWDAIKSAFPADDDIYGRVIVTTSVNRIAEECWSHGGSVYRMQALSKELSWEFLRNKVFVSPMQCSRDMQSICEDGIVAKCDGLPLALVCIGQLLRAISDKLTENSIAELSTRLGYYMEMSPALAGMQQAIVRTYDSLPGHDLKNCFLSLSMFPHGRPIKKKSLVRRWLAEGLVAKAIDSDGEKKADEYVEELINRNVIQPVGSSSSSNSRVKACQIHGVILDFIVHKSVSENFITLVHKDKTLWMNKEVARRLSVHNTDAESGRMAMEMDLSRVRSLAIFKHDCKDLGDFQRCKLLRALDLEDCKGLGDGVLDSICELLLLKYLSLKGCTDVSMLPKKMYKLEALETLDIRGTGVSVVPMGVLTLPLLAHLFGRFRLPSELGKVGTSSKMQRFFSEKSKLQTLAGFAIDQSPGFEHIIDNMSKLGKVKIWCAAVPESSANRTLVSSLEKRLHRHMPIKSLSVDFGDLPIDFLYSLSTSCVCNSIKLRGKLSHNNGLLPDFILSHDKLLELHLLSVDLHSEALAGLGKLNLLRFLKIADHRRDFGDGKFDVRSDGFPSLEHLCFETPKLPKVTIDEGAMPKLTTLQLFCANVEGLDAKDIGNLQNLKEVTLTHFVPTKAKEAWEDAVKVHINRPTIRTCGPKSSL